MQALYLYFMYDLPHFKASDDSEVIAFMHAHPFIILCGCGSNGFPAATHIPVLIEDRENTIYLQGHIMRGQTHEKAFTSNENVLAIFSGAHTYVSASWYKQKNVGSTWNYRAVHAQGILRFLDDDGLYNLLVNLTAKYEAADSPSLVKHMKPGYISSLMKQIIAFEIKLTNVEHVFKLSQNRDEESYESIAEHLGNAEDSDAKEIATLMRDRNKL